MNYYKPKIQHINLKISALDFRRYTDFVGIAEEYLARPVLLSSLLKDRTTMSLLTTMPRTLKIFGTAPADYTQWLCGRANRPLSKPQFTPKNTTVEALEDKVGKILKEEGSRRTPRETFDAFAENTRTAMGEVLRDHKVNSVNQWMRARFGFDDQGLGPVRIVSLNDSGCEVRLGFNTRKDLTAYADNMRAWLQEKGVEGQVTYTPL